MSSDIVENGGEIPYLCASAENNAISTYTEYDRKFLEKGNCIFIGGKTFVVTYQEKDFFSNDSHNLALYLKEENKSKAVFLYMASCIYKGLCKKYSWGNSISKAKIQDDVVMLPINEDGSIDFDFMESFIAELEAERLAELEAYLKITGLDNYELTEAEEKALEEYCHFEWKDFDVLDIFDVKNTHNILSRDIIETNGSTPYLCASADNNSVDSYIDYDPAFLEKGHCIFIGGKTFTVTYQEKDFFSNDSHNLALYTKNIFANKAKQFCLATCLRCSLSNQYSWGNSISKAKIKNDKISLPVKDGEPDYGWMDTFVSAIQKLVIKNVVLYADQKIQATETVIRNKPAKEYPTVSFPNTLAADSEV